MKKKILIPLVIIIFLMVSAFIGIKLYSVDTRDKNVLNSNIKENITNNNQESSNSVPKENIKDENLDEFDEEKNDETKQLDFDTSNNSLQNDNSNSSEILNNENQNNNELTIESNYNEDYSNQYKPIEQQPSIPEVVPVQIPEKPIEQQPKPTGPWDILGISEYEYYNSPAHSWAEVDFKVSDYGSKEATLNACIEYGNKHKSEHGGGFFCDAVNSYSGNYLGEDISFY